MLLKFSSNLYLFMCLIFTEAEAIKSRKANTTCGVCIWKGKRSKLTDEVHGSRRKITFWATSDLGRCLTSWDVILKSSECETWSSWQGRAANDILETGLIWGTIKSHFPEICLLQILSMLKSRWKVQLWKCIGLGMKRPLTQAELILLYIESPF